MCWRCYVSCKSFPLFLIKCFPFASGSFETMLLGAVYLTTLLQFMHRAQFHKHVYDFCSWLNEHTRRRRLWTLCQPDTNRVGVWCVTLGRETLVNWITSHVAFVIVQRTRFLGMPHASRGPFATHTHTPHELSRTYYSHICAFCCVWVPDVDNDCTGVSFQNLLQTQDCISSLWTRCAVDTLTQYEISSLNDTTKGYVSGYIIEWNYPTHRWAWMWSVLLVRAFRYTGNKNEWIVWWCGWTCTMKITLLKGFLDSLAYTDDTYRFTLFCVIEWFTFVYISVFPKHGRRDISVGVVIRMWAGRPRNRS